MGFFSDLKEDLSQAVTELMPGDDLGAAEGQETVAEEQEERDIDLEKMLENIDSVSWEEDAEEPLMEEPQIAEEEREAVEEAHIDQSEETEEEPAQGSLGESDEDYDLERMLAQALENDSVYAEEVAAQSKGEEKKMDSYGSRTVSEETSIITAGMTITGDLVSEGSLDIIGNVNGNIEVMGKLNITGQINGNSKAAEIYAESAKINGEVVSLGAVKIGASSVIIGNIEATSAAIAGAVKGDIDVKGPVILDASAIVMGNIKSKSVQINNGAVIEGMCSQCYADVNPTNFFDDYKMGTKK